VVQIGTHRYNLTLNNIAAENEQKIMPINLMTISNFGGTDADEDALLLDSFEDHPAYSQIVHHERFCILGRKGSGKTAIFKKILQDRQANTFSFGHTFTDYPWHHHDKQRKVGVPEEQCFVQSWTELSPIFGDGRAGQAAAVLG
jgi:hypothetical protein